MTPHPPSKDYDWVFSHGYAAGILCFVNDVGVALVKDVLSVCSNHRTMSRVIDELIAYGLLQMEVARAGRISKRITVTDKGRVVAERLEQLRRLVEGPTTKVEGVPPIENY